MTTAVPAAPLKTPLSFKLLSLNTHKGFTSFNRKFILHELREAVRDAGADIVFLQEVIGSHEVYSKSHKNWPPTPQYEFLADSIWPEFAYGRNAVYSEGHHGNAVLSKFPILHFENHDVSVGEVEKRGLLHCVLKIPGPGIEVHAICVHLSIFTGRRKQQFQLLCDLIDKSVPASAPLFVCGDFNDWQVRAHKPLARCGLKEAFVVAHGRAARTWPAFFPVTRLDRIYYRNARVFSPAVLSAQPWSHLSDHAGVSAKVEL